MKNYREQREKLQFIYPTAKKVTCQIRKPTRVKGLLWLCARILGTPKNLYSEVPELWRSPNQGSQNLKCPGLDS